MIFKTIDSSIDSSRKSIALFNKDWNTYFNNFKNASGIKNKVLSIVSSNDVNCLKAYNQQITNGINPSKAYKNTMASCTKEAKQHAVAIAKGTTTIDTAIKSIKESTLAAKANKIAMTAMSTALNIGVFTLITIAVSKLISLFDELIHSEENLRQSASDLGYELSNNSSDIKDYKKKIEKLKSVINDSSSSFDEVSQARADLMQIQNELIDKFGTEKSVIESITSAINDQTDALDELNRKKYFQAKNEFNKKNGGEKFSDWLSFGNTDDDRIHSKMDEMVYAMKYSFYDLKTTGNEVLDYLITKAYGLNITEDMYGNGKHFEIHGTLEEIQDKLYGIQELSQGFDLSTSFENSFTKISTDVDDSLAKYKSLYEQYLLYEKILTNNPDNEYDEQFDLINKAKEAFDEASKLDDAGQIKVASDEYAQTLQSAIDLAMKNYDYDVADYFRSMYPDLQQMFGEWQFELNFGVNTDGLKDKVVNALDSIDGVSDGTASFSVENIKNFNPNTATQEQVDAYGELINVAEYYGLTIQQLIILLQTLGLVQSESYQQLANTFGKDNVDKLSPEDLKIAYTIENVGNMTFEEFQEAIAEAKKEAEKSAEAAATPKTFQEAWDAFGTTGDEDTKKAAQEAKEELLELAKAGKLTPEVLENNKTFATLLKSVGNNAEKATKEINQMVEPSDQLSSMKSGISAISNVLAEKKDNLKNKKTKEVGIGADTLAGFDDDIKGLDSWKNFEKTLGNGKSYMEECREAANKLATEWVNSNNFLSQLDETKEDYYISTLKEMGVENAEAVVTASLTQKKKDLELAEKYSKAAKESTVVTTNDLSSATANEINQLANEQKWSDETKQALYRLALQKQIANGIHLNTSKDINNLKAFVKGLGGTATALETYQEMLKHGGSYSTTEMANKWREAQKEVEDAANNVEVEVTPDPVTSDSGNSKNNNNKSKTKATKQYFDWLERKITVLTNKLDFLKAKLENVFSVQKKNSIIDDEINNTNKLIKTYQKQEKIYKQQANKSAKSKKTESGEKKTKLSKELQKQIQTGQIKGSRKQLIKAYGEKKANAIQEYQDYWDKYQETRTKIQTANKDKRELKIQKHQNWVDYYDSIGSQYDARIENASTAKTKNDLEKDKLGYIKKSYNQQIKIAKLENDSVKAATLLAQKWKEIANTREQILQNSLDENADKRDYNNAAYENADNAGKKSLIQKDIATYNSDNDAYAENVNSAKKDLDRANSDVSKTAKSASKRLKKESINSKIVKEINSYLNSGKKVPDEYLLMAKGLFPELYEKLVEYNNSIDIAGSAKEALAKAQEKQQKALEENNTAIREEKSKSIQLDIDAANNRKDRLTAEYNNLTKTEDKNTNIDSQWLQQYEIHNKTVDQLNNDITDATELADALAKEEAEWLSTWREMEVLKLQNLADEESAQYALNQQKEVNANSAEVKNQFEAESRKHLQAQYDYEMQIAEKNGDRTEQERLRLELEQKIEESYQRQIDNIKEEYDLIIGLNDARKSTIDAQISALQANGYDIATELYTRQQEIALENYQSTQSKINDITAEMQNLDPESQAYKNYLIELETYKQEAWGYQQAWAEAQQAINDINLSKIEHVGTLLGYQANQLEHIQNILGHSDFTLSAKDGGGLTMKGLASVAVTFQQMQNNNDQIANKRDQITEINRQIDAHEYVGSRAQAEEDIYNLLKEIEDLEEANYDFGESVKNLVIDSLNSLSDALDESISKYKDALKVQKDLFDYRRKVADQLKSIASLEKQLAALQGSDTEEARARIQKIQIELENERQNLKDTEYDKYIQDQEEMLDKVSDDFQDFIANVTKMSVSTICEEMGKVVTDNATEIANTITNAFADSTEIGSVASSVSSLKEVMEKTDFSTKITLNLNSNGVPTSMTIDGKEVTVSKQDDDMSDAANDTASDTASDATNNTANNNENTSANTGNTELKQSIESYIKKLNSYVSDADAGMSLSIDPLNQFLHTKHGKMATSFEKFQILKRLGLLQNGWGDEKNREILGQAVEKLQHLGFSQGGIATQLNRIALANGDDGWATLKRGESVLTPAQTEQFQKLVENLAPLNTVASSVASLPANPVSVRHSPASTTTVRNVDIHLDGSHVMDADSFIQTLHNPRVLREVSSGVSSQLNSVMSNKLGNF